MNPREIAAVLVGAAVLLGCAAGTVDIDRSATNARPAPAGESSDSLGALLREHGSVTLALLNGSMTIRHEMRPGDSCRFVIRQTIVAGLQTGPDAVDYGLDLAGVPMTIAVAGPTKEGLFVVRIATLSGAPDISATRVRPAGARAKPESVLDITVRSSSAAAAVESSLRTAAAACQTRRVGEPRGHGIPFHQEERHR